MNKSSEALPALRWAAGLLLVLGVLSRILGLVREIIVATFFGVSADLDALYLGMSLPAIVTLGIGNGIFRSGVAATAGLNSHRLSGLLRTGGKRTILILAPVSGLLAISTSLIAWWFVATPQTQFAPLIVGTVVGSLTLVAAGISGILAGIADGRGRHIGTAVSPLVYNFTMIGTIILTFETFGVLSLVLGFFAGEWSQIVCYGYALGPDVRRTKPDFRESDWSFWKSKFWPASVAALLLASNQMVDRAFAIRLIEGSTAALAYADKLVNLPVGLLGTALAVPLFTRLSKFRNEGREKAYRVTVMLGIRLVFLVGIPLGLLLVLLAEPIVGVLLQRGAFDLRAVELTATAFVGFAPGIPFLTLSILLVSATLTTAKPWRLIWWLLISVLLNAVLNAILAGPFGVRGIAISSSIVSFFRVIVLLAIVSSGLFYQKSLYRSLIRIIIISIPAFFFAGLVYQLVQPDEAIQMLERITDSILCTFAFCVGALFCFPLIRQEWSSISALRRIAAKENLKT